MRKMQTDGIWALCHSSYFACFCSLLNYIIVTRELHCSELTMQLLTVACWVIRRLNSRAKKDSCMHAFCHAQTHTWQACSQTLFKAECTHKCGTVATFPLLGLNMWMYIPADPGKRTWKKENSSPVGVDEQTNKNVKNKFFVKVVVISVMLWKKCFSKYTQTIDNIVSEP